MRLLNLMNIINDMTNLPFLKSTCRVKTAELYSDYFDLYMIGLDTTLKFRLRNLTKLI
jgi:hypothetical protein